MVKVKLLKRITREKRFCVKIAKKRKSRRKKVKNEREIISYSIEQMVMKEKQKRQRKKIEGKREIYGDLIAFDDNKVTIKANLKGQTKIIEIDVENIKKIRLAVRF